MSFRSALLVLLGLAVPLGADERVRPYVDAGLPRVVVAGEAGALLDPVSAAAWRAWAGSGADLGVAVSGPVAVPAATAGTRTWRHLGAFTVRDSALVPPEWREWAQKSTASATRCDGFTPSDPTEVVDTTRESVFRFVADRMNEAFDAGFDAFRLADYAWPSQGGRWGTGPAAMAQWRSYLKGRGPRIDLSGPDETWDFPAYWARFSSLPLLPPSFGWDTWDDFRYGGGFQTFAARRMLLFDALWHFQHLSFADRLGREAEARGGEFGVVLPLEDRLSGGDDALFGRLRHLGSLAVALPESPAGLPALRHTLAPLRWREGKAPRVDLAGAKPGQAARMDRDIAAAFYYELAASCAPRLDTAPVEAAWPERAKLDAAGKERFGVWEAGAAAFRLRHAEEAAAPPARSDVTVVASRAIVEDVPGSHSLAQDGNLAPYLEALHADFEQVGRDVWNAALDRHSRVVVYCPARSTPDQLKAVRAWLGEGRGKILVAVGGAPWRSDQEGETELALFPLAGEREAGLAFADEMLRTSCWEAAVSSRKALVSDAAGAPLLTTWKAGDNRVLHLNADLPLSAPLSPLGLALVRELLDRAKIATYAPPQPDWNVERYGVVGGAVAVAWNRPLLARQEEKGRFAREPLPAPGEVVLDAPPDQVLRLYSAFDDKVWLQSADGEGKLHVAAASSPLFLYYGADAPAFRETIVRARAALHPAE